MGMLNKFSILCVYCYCVHYYILDWRYVSPSGRGSNFGKKSMNGNRVFGYFDISSIMEYGQSVSCLFVSHSIKQCCVSYIVLILDCRATKQTGDTCEPSQLRNTLDKGFVTGK